MPMTRSSEKPWLLREAEQMRLIGVQALARSRDPGIAALVRVTECEERHRDGPAI